MPPLLQNPKRTRTGLHCSRDGRRALIVVHQPRASQSVSSVLTALICLYYDASVLRHSVFFFIFIFFISVYFNLFIFNLKFSCQGKWWDSSKKDEENNFGQQVVSCSLV